MKKALACIMICATCGVVILMKNKKCCLHKQIKQMKKSGMNVINKVKAIF